MKGKIQDKGLYELLQSERGRIMINFNGANTYVWSSENNIEILRLTKGISYKSGDGHFNPIQTGPYFIINLEYDSFYNGLPHLYLKHEDHYDEYVIQDGLPNTLDPDKEIIPTNRIISAEQLEGYFIETVKDQVPRLI